MSIWFNRSLFAVVTLVTTVFFNAQVFSAQTSSPWSPTTDEIIDAVDWQPSDPNQFHVFSGQHVVVPTDEESYLNHLTPELVSHYDVILYVDKNAKGGVAQRVIWLEKPLEGNAWNHWRPRYVWRTSTGRERQEEKGFSGTPTGIYNLHGTRQHAYYESRLFDGSPMPFTMFIDHKNTWGGGSGIAFHAAPTYAHHKLGNRASGGCMRLHYDNARYMFHTLRANHRGYVPKMAYLDNGSTNLTGHIMHDEFGRVVKRKGVKALVVIDDGKFTAVQDQMVFAAYTPKTKPAGLAFHLPNLVVEIDEKAIVRPTVGTTPRRKKNRATAAKPKKIKTKARSRIQQRSADAR